MKLTAADIRAMGHGKRRAPARPEGDLVRACLQLLRLRGVFAWRVNSGAIKLDKRFVRFNSINGISDIIGILPGGRILAVEAKVGRNKTSEAQDAFLAEVRSRGGVAVVAYEVEDVEKALREEK